MSEIFFLAKRPVSFLSQRNPLAVILASVFFLIPIILSFDRPTPIIFFTIGILHFFVLGKVTIKKYLKVFLPLSILPVSLFLMNYLFPAEGINGLERAITIFLRSFCTIGVSIMTVFVLDPYACVNAAMQNLKMPYRVGFSFFAAWNALPLVQRDLTIMRRTQELRGRREIFVRRFVRILIALLAGMIRHAERVTVSMVARGLDIVTQRSFRIEQRWTKADTLYCVIIFLICATIFAWLIIKKIFVFSLG